MKLPWQLTGCHRDHDNPALLVVMYRCTYLGRTAWMEVSQPRASLQKTRTKYRFWTYDQGAQGADKVFYTEAGLINHLEATAEAGGTER